MFEWKSIYIIKSYNQNMIKTLNQILKLEGIKLKLPQLGFGVTSHLDNLVYCIEKLRKSSKNGNTPVLIYRTLTLSDMRSKEIFHKIVPYEQAEKLKTEDSRFNFYTLDELLKEKKAYKSGKYIVRNRHFIGLNPSY